MPGDPGLRLMILRRAAVIGAGVLLAAAVMACGSDEPAPQAYITWVPNDTPTSAPTRRIVRVPDTPTRAIEPTAVPTEDIVTPPSPRPPQVDPLPKIRGFAFPIAGACLPSSDNLMPNAPRSYRAGVHEGVDFYNGYNCTGIGQGTPVLAAKSGTVIRADHAYRNLTQAELDAALQAAISSGGTDQESLDTFRGRQVWVEHTDGTVTRYAHLSGIAAGVTTGDVVGQGELIGYVGESGTPESVTNPGTEYHLHFELRVGGSYLGAGSSAGTVRQLYEQAFSP
jgi:murein DD-endopeptidase MepM/ murein hydrolase activator NlpD